ncbi:MAG: putative Holliday junction resolvase-like endonuclease [Candidatus Azotimanducaceae bacterium]|jgi:predicted Holliday junction resolvase-like endonuclease
MKYRRRNIEGMSLAFLDVISCGFGALILLLVLTKVFEPVIFEDTIENLESHLAALQEDLFEIRGDSRQLNRDMIRREDKHTDTKDKLVKVQNTLAALQGKFDTATQETQVDDTIRGRLEVAKQSLSEEMQRLLAEYQKNSDDDTIAGIPVDSEYVIFIIDTSGSMRGFAWPLLQRKIDEILQVYPRLKGIQVMNDMGQFMFSQYANEWIPDTRARRAAILDRLQSWDTFSNSSPVEGITKAIAMYYRPDKKISLYVMGDEFSGRSIQRVIDIVDRINQPDKDGERLVRIHAIGFPVQFDRPQQFQTTGIRFAILMRELCARNGGTFVGLNDYRAF